MNKTTEALKMAIEVLENPSISVITYVTNCHGDKCRESYCEACFGDDAIEVVERNKLFIETLHKAINACKEALKSQEQEPVAWMMVHRPPHEGAAYLTFEKPTREQKISHHPYELYAHPAQQFDYEKFCDLLSNYRKYVYEFGLSDDPETYEMMLNTQRELHELVNKKV